MTRDGAEKYANAPLMCAKIMDGHGDEAAVIPLLSAFSVEEGHAGWRRIPI